MLRVVFKRRFGKVSLIALTLLLAIAAAATISAVRPVSSFAASLDTCGYNPAASPSPSGGTVVFDENTVTRAIQFYGTGLSGHVGVFANDESGLNIGSGGTPSSSAGSNVGTAGTLAANTTVTSIPVPAGTTVAVSSGDSVTVTLSGKSTTFTASANAAAAATSIPVSSKSVGPNALTGGTISDSSIVWGQAVPPTFGPGSDAENRPTAPTIFLTDITSNASATGGDWQHGGQAATTGATGLFGSWTATTGTDPVNKNNWVLGPNADAIPATDAFGGTTTSFNEGYGAEVTWNAPGLVAYDPTTNTFGPIQAGHTYRVQSMTHDGDQNHTSGGGDVGEVCTTFHIPAPNLSITKTADASPVNAGDSIGFTVEIKNTGDTAATGASLNDPLPAGSGSGVTWAIDNSTGTPANFTLTGTKPNQTLGLASSTIPVGADYKIHITASTSATACGQYDNTATLTSTGSNPPPASASEVCTPANVTVTKTADAASVNAGDQVGFTVEVKNTGTGLAKGVSLSDPLPVGSGTGVTWAVDGSTGTPAQFVLAGAKGSQTLSLASNTLAAGADYTVHITATTSFAECSVYDNTATVTTTNANNPSPAEAVVTCNKSNIHILKTPDAAQVNAGEQIGFTMTVWNTGAGDAKGTTLSDPLPTNTGLNWTIASQGAGWGNTCAIAAGTLTCGAKTIPAGTTQAASTFTVHITSTTTAATGGDCPTTGVVDNTGSVTTTNGGSDQSEATTCVAKPVIKIVKTADAAQVNAGDQIGFTMTVYNTGTGDAKNATLNDPLPTNPGLSWTIESQGAGWGGTCAITLGTLNCGPKTVPAGTTQAASTFTVHITSTTTSATSGDCPTTGVVDNTGTVTISNGGSDQSEATTCVAKPIIKIVKTADAAQVNAGEQIGFTLTVYNTGTGDAKGVALSDPLPTNPGLNWTIANQGAGWGNTCSITLGTLNCGPKTVAAGTTQAASTFTVHITSTTTSATGGVCPSGSGVVNNTGTVTTTNDGSDQSSASTCVAGAIIHILKTADAAQVNAGDQIGFTLTVYNTGTGDAKGVNLSDLLPTNPGLNWTIAGQGAGWGNTCAIALGTLTCGPKTVAAGTTLAASTFTVHITSTTTTATGGVCPGGSGVVNNTGNVTTTNDGSDQSSASTCVAAPAIHIVKTADAAQVNAGDQIGFTLTVSNSGTGDAYGVNLNDPLPTNPGLSWTIASQGSGWGGTCAITLGTLKCGPVTVPAGTTQVASTFKVHITSTTTAATGGSCPDSGVVTNTGSVTTTNDGSDDSTATVCVAKPVIRILKTADAAQVNAGDQIGFTLTVYNTGIGDAKGVALSDPLPTNPGLSWQIANQGAGWASTCSITLGTLNCGPKTVPAGTTLAASTFTVHITSTTTAATGGVCPGGSGVVNNTGSVTTTNDGSDQSTASTCVAAPVIKILKTADAAQVSAGDPIGFTMTVYNTGTGDAKGVALSDPLPTNPGLNWTIAAQGAGWAGTCSITLGTLNCGPKTVAAGTTLAASTFTVHITSTTTAATGGSCPTTGVVNNTGSVTTTNDGSDQSSASVCVAAPGIQIVKTADAAQVNAGDQIGFVVTVFNTGTGDAKGVTLSDPLPTNAGLNWTIASQGAGWGGTCAISLGTLNCGGLNGVTVPFGTTQIGSTFTVHITSTTTAATGGVCPSGSGVVNNTGTVNTTNAGTKQASASTCVAAPSIKILKTADAAQVNAGDQIGFTLTVYNTGSGDAKGVNLNDPLPANAGLNWTIENQGAGWANSCSIALGTLKCGPVTVPAGTTLAASSFTVHITSTTTAATGGVCPSGSGVVNNTGSVTTTNDGSDQSSASTCVAGAIIHILKTADAAQVNAGDQIGFTLTVYNTGTGDAKGVNLNDPLPTNAGLNWTIASQGAGWGGTCSITLGTLKCGPATVPAGTTLAASSFTVHITSTTTSATGGVCPSGSGVVNNTGNVTTTNDGSDQSSASTCVAGAIIHIVKTADAAQVNAGEQIGFTLTVYNTGSGDAKGVALSDPLPTNPGLSWTIENQGAGWASTCSITAGTLNCGPKTVAAGTTLAASTFTVHITSTTTAATGGVCPGGSGVVNNTGSVTTTNDGSDQSSASTCVAAPAIKIVKTADAAQVNAGDQIGFTLTVYNTGTGDAKGVNLSDPLPTNAGLNWTIAGQGAGWSGSCDIAAGTLTCGPVTVPAGTTQAASTFTVHITSTTTAATGGVCPGGSGVVNNTGSVTTTNDGSGQASASTCVAAPAIKIVKTADAAQVNAGDQIGFTLTVYNTGGGDAKGVNLSDPLPTNAGLNWTIANQGAGWSGTCSITAGTLNCGPVTVPGATTQAASTYTVHITSTTTSATGGSCPGGSGVVDNTGSVTTTNDGSGQASASTCVASPVIKIVKTADAAQVNAGDQIGFTLTVSNSGTGDAKGVNLSDPLPTNAGLNWTIASQGAGWGGTCDIAAGTLTCGPKTVAAGTTQAASTFTVHITSTTTAATGGSCPNTGVVNNTGSVTTTNDGSDQSSASVCVAAPSVQILKTADAAQVNAGDQIGFTVTVYNTGTGDAKGVTMTDPLPTNAGLSWHIASQGAGWGGTCAIAAGTLTCGPSTVPFGTMLAGSTFTVHITSTTTAATAGACPTTGVVDNTASVTTTNDGSGQSSASTCVAGANIQIVKTADAAQVNQGDQIGFTMTVYNPGSGDAKGVTLSDPLPTNAGLSWTIASQGAGWASTCAITAGTLNCGPVTVPGGTTQAASTYTVHITSTTGAGSGGLCPDTGVVDNTGSVTTTNDGSGQSSASTCIEGVTDLQITKTGLPKTQNQDPPYQNITWTMIVKNNGPDVDTNVMVADPMPAGNTYVSYTTTKGTCTGGAILNCSLGTMQVGDTVTITLVTAPSVTGQQVNTATVVGDLPESNTTNNTATASVLINGPSIPPCVAVAVLPKQLYAGRATTMHITVTQDHKAVKGVRVQIKGPGLHKKTKASNAKGKITAKIHPKKAGIITFKPIVTKANGGACKLPRVGVTGVFTPPVTG